MEKIFVVELHEWYETERQMMGGILDYCYTQKFRSKSFWAQSADGWSKKVVCFKRGDCLSEINISETGKYLPNWLFPFMLTKNKKNTFYRDRAAMLAALEDGEEYILTTTSETILNAQGTIAFFNIKKDGAVLIVDGKKHNL